jgi:glutamyl-tRNA synthetase
MDKKVRVRFAPSPTGALHIGGVRTALYNYLFAMKHGGDFILRVEDTDSKREVAGAIKYITDSFEWLGFKPNEGYGIGGDHGPYIQSERQDIYYKYIKTLVDSGHAYYAFDSKEELASMKDSLRAAGIKNTGYAGVVRERMKNSLYMASDDVKAKIDAGDSYVVRFKMPRDENVKFKDEVRGWITFNTKDLDDKVIWKSSDGLPTYHMANVIDDHLMEISHVIRGEEWVTSTPLHVLMYDAFGWEHPVYAHLPLILAPNKKKLGKRDGDKYGIPVFPIDWDYIDSDGNDISISGFREAGIEPDALVNFLSLLGWNPGGDVEHMSMDEMINLFDTERINQAGAMFDIKKLNSFNSHYLRNRDTDWIIDKMNIPADHGLSDDKIDMIASMATERATYAYELDGIVDYIYNTPVLEEDIKMKNVEDFVRVMNVFAADDFMDDFEESEWIPKNIRYELEHISANMSIKVGKIMPMLRTALCGGASGPQLPDVMYVIGPKETKLRIDTLLNKIKELA